MQKMQKRITSKHVAILFCLVICFVSCAHKSGHRRDREHPGTTMADCSNGKSSRSTARKSKIVNKRSSDKLEGSQIFDRYGSAVFMVFTTDGSNTYQGSGFFIDNGGLAVSNYHVFKGTGIGLEHIKLVGSDMAYKVTEIITRSEDEDFILFRVDCDNNNYIPIATEKPKIGEKVYAIGSPRGLETPSPPAKCLNGVQIILCKLVRLLTMVAVVVLLSMNMVKSWVLPLVRLLTVHKPILTTPGA